MLMPYFVCPKCNRPHNVEEYREQRFCRGCGTYLPTKSRVLKSEYEELVVKEGKKAGDIFPYRPYTQQLEFMEDIEVVVGNGGVLVAEACNGFGKTVCALSVLLSSGLRIVYATRTHEQVRQVLDEMEQINKKSDMKYSAVNLASRQHLCLNEKCSSLPARDTIEVCHLLREEGQCPYEWEISELRFQLPPVLSIRVLRRWGKMKGLCPYFMARVAAGTSRVVVAPYNYVFDQKIRQKINLSLSGSVLVFDEAHNADAVALTVLSDTLSDRTLNQAKHELKDVEKATDFLDYLQSYLEENVTVDKAFAKPGTDLFEDLKNVIGEAPISSLINSYSEVIDDIRSHKMERGESPVSYLNGVLQFLNLVDASPKESYVAIYRTSSYGLRIIEYRCLDPSLAIKPVVDEVNGLLIMSGTLSPVELFAQILGLPDAEVRAYSAIAKAENIQLLIDSSVTTKFSERSEAMMTQYGEKIAKVASSIPNGVLIFFPQRTLMMNTLKGWRERGLVEQRSGVSFLGCKKVFVEGVTAVENREVVEEYKRYAEGQGGVLCCVFRGRNAEGSNFPDEQVRGVILVGVPYADISDPVVKAQIGYFNRKRFGLGERWYVMDAFKAANQAIGRGIRHKDDWCNFILMDQRYGNHLKLLSSWTRSGEVKNITI